MRTQIGMNNHHYNEDEADKEDQRTAMLHALLKQSEQFTSLSQPPSLMNNVMNDVFTPNQPFAFQNADLCRLQNHPFENFGGAGTHHQQLSGQLNPSDNFQLLMQLQQQQLQQQHQLLLQAGGLAGQGRYGIQMETMGGGSDYNNANYGGQGIQAASAQNEEWRSALAANFAEPSSSVVINPTPRRRAQSFPLTLHRVLADLELAGATHIATFVDDGNAFLVRSPKEFEIKILPEYFPRMSSFGSFQRQLNLYNFKRISQGPHRGSYSHPHFRRSDPEASKDMKRTKIKGGPSKKADSNYAA